MEKLTESKEYFKKLIELHKAMIKSKEEFKQKDRLVFEKTKIFCKIIEKPAKEHGFSKEIEELRILINKWGVLEGYLGKNRNDKIEAEVTKR